MDANERELYLDCATDRARAAQTVAALYERRL
jgi:hypothetical protein